MTVILNLIFRGKVTKILNFAMKIKGGVREGGTGKFLRPCHPPPKKNLERAPVSEGSE